MVSQFSSDGKYFARISSDGRLKIWDTISNSFEQEFTPDFHLTTPCICLHFLQPEITNKVSPRSSPSPKKKKWKEDPNISPNIVLGTTSGLLLVYSISRASIGFTIDSKTNSAVNCLSSANNHLLYSGANKNILEWNLKKKALKSQWKGGNEIISAILAIPDSKHILTASRNIKHWDVETKEVIKVFTGHSSDVIFMEYVNPTGNDAYLLSGSKADRLLSCWNLSHDERQKNAVCNYLMEDVVQNVSLSITDDGITSIAATVKSGVVHVYQHKLNGKCDKPLKPKTTIQVVSDTGQHKDLVAPIRIFGALFRDEESLCIGHGSEVILTFENVTISTYQKLYCLIRKDPRVSKTSKEDQITKIKTPLVGEDVHYLTPHNSTILTKRKTEGQTEIPMEQRLENLALNKSDSSSKVPKADNVAQLLVQGLHSNDKNLLRTALCKKDENVIRNTVKRLPVTVFEALIKELSNLVHGKTISSHFGALWLKHFAQIHAGILISNPNLSEIFSEALSSIHSRLSLQTPLNRLRGKLELLVPQVGTSSNVENNVEDEALLVFNDKDTSESESDENEMQIEIPSDSENEEWQESDLEQENHIDESGSDSDSVVMIED